jgi:hypothetical protein
MNNGTILRTILAIAVSINTALAVTDVTGFESDQLNTIYKIASMIVNFIVVALNTYYNNDYTEEACIGTGITRELKEKNSEPDNFIEEEESHENEDDL